MLERQTIEGKQHYNGFIKIEIMVIEIHHLYYRCVMLCLLGGIRGSEEAAGVAKKESGARNRVIGHRTAANWKGAIMLSGAADLTEDLK